MSAVTVKDGKLIVHLETIIRDETMLREIAKSAIFDELLLTAVISLIVSGEIDWQDGDCPWWIGSSDYGPRFKAMRVKVAALAEPGTQKLLAELRRQRDIVVAQSNVYQDRAWRAERLVKWNNEKLRSWCAHSEQDLADIDAVDRVPAHAEVDTAKFTGEEKP
mgnify:FL=1